MHHFSSTRLFERCDSIEGCFSTIQDTFAYFVHLRLAISVFVVSGFQEFR